MTQSDPDGKAGDVSNQAVAVLLVLTILVTVVGTWLVLDAFAGVSAAPQTGAEGGERDARVSFELQSQPYDTQAAQVGFTLVEPPKQ